MIPLGPHYAGLFYARPLYAGLFYARPVYAGLFYCGPLMRAFLLFQRCRRLDNRKATRLLREDERHFHVHAVLDDLAAFDDHFLILHPSALDVFKRLFY